MAVLTKKGSRKVNSYIAELAAKQKGILDAGIDTARSTLLPTPADIENDIDYEGVDAEGYYGSSWGVTDHYDSDSALWLQKNVDFTE